MPRVVRGIFFDLVGTLIRSTQPIGEQYAAWARKHGAHQADPVRLGAAFRQAMREARPMAFPGLAAGEVGLAERAWWLELVRGIVARSGLGDALRAERFDTFFDDLYRHFQTSAAWEAFPDALPVLHALRERGLVVGLITNYDTRVHALLGALGLSSCLDSVTTPALACAAKPDRRIFERALAAHRLDASSAIYVGDEPRDDYAGAEGAGMTAVLLDREGNYGGGAYRRIVGLEELLEP
jgi:putative hydrolase of the HAD superfamily